jgi:hypothetical protein
MSFCIGAKSFERLVCAFFVLCVFHFVHGVARAQNAPLPGQRVRIAISDSLRVVPFAKRLRPMIGTLQSVSHDSIWVLLANGSATAINRQSVQTISTSRGASRMRSALEQGVFGGLLLYVVSGGTRKHQLSAATVGLGIGSVVGAISPYEHWKRRE